MDNPYCSFTRTRVRSRDSGGGLISIEAHEGDGPLAVLVIAAATYNCLQHPTCCRRGRALACPLLPRLLLRALLASPSAACFGGLQLHTLSVPFEHTGYWNHVFSVPLVALLSLCALRRAFLVHSALSLLLLCCPPLPLLLLLPLPSPSSPCLPAPSLAPARSLSRACEGSNCSQRVAGIILSVPLVALPSLCAFSLSLCALCRAFRVHLPSW